MTKRQRREAVVRAWVGHVGELPDDGVNRLCTHAAVYGVEVTQRAIERTSFVDSLETSEDVLIGVDGLLRAWASRGWCP